MKKKHIIILFIFVVALIWGTFYLSNWNTNYYDKTCLKEKAISYCENNNMTFHSGEVAKFNLMYYNHFICEEVIIENPRKNAYPNQENFLFLDEELEECKSVKGTAEVQER